MPCKLALNNQNFTLIRNIQQKIICFKRKNFGLVVIIKVYKQKTNKKSKIKKKYVNVNENLFS